MEREFYSAKNSLLSYSTSRISWGAVFGGVFVAFVGILLLNTFGIAVGLTGDGSLGTGTLIWSVLVALVSLFAGGWVMSYLVNRETKVDATIHATILWGVLFLGVLILAIFGVQTGLSVLTGTLNTFAQQFSISEMMNLAQQLGLDEQQVNQLQQRLNEVNIQKAASAWWSFLGLLVSWISVVAGSLAGKNRPRLMKEAYMRQEEQRDQHSVA